MKKMSVCCCTYNRPEMLGELIQSYLIQTYPAELRELIILDDAGQYDNLRGDGWQIVSFPRRFASLGEKRNACVSLTSHESDWIVIADDDDIYLPHWLESHAFNLERGAEWSFASLVYWSRANRITHTWRYPKQGWIVHPTCAFTKEIFWQVNGYPHLAWREDQFFYKRLHDVGIEPVDALRENQQSFFVYRRKENPEHRHTTNVTLKSYRNNFLQELPPAEVRVGWNRDYVQDIQHYETIKATGRTLY